MFKPGSPRVSGSLVRKDCVFGKSWQCSPRGKQWRRLFGKPEEASALHILLHRGPGSPPLLVGQCRPASKPCLKPSGGWAFSFATGFSFPRLKRTSMILWALVPRAFGVCWSGAPILHCSSTGSKWEVGDVGGSRGLLRLTSHVHHLMALRTFVGSGFTSVRWGYYYYLLHKTTGNKWDESKTDGTGPGTELSASCSCGGRRRGADERTFKVRKGLLSRLLKIYCFLLAEQFYKPTESHCHASSAWIPTPTLRIMSHSRLTSCGNPNQTAFSFG